MKFYGEDCPPPRAKRVEDLHAQEVMLRAAIIEEFRAVFNIASLFADAIAAMDPNHHLLNIARFEGMLGRFELTPQEKEFEKEIDALYQPVESSSVQAMPEGGVLEVPVGAIRSRQDDGVGAVHDGEAIGVGDMLPQGGGSPDAEADGDGSSASSLDRGREVSISGSGREELAPSSVPSVGEGGSGGVP